ncbi:MAG: hydantoinase B/oxoprolinase family protein [Armatimonadetes bacterium]|nr:hydantoinase B/oxoprolinase family protein [Armatimonadota bacterium]
MREAMDPVSLSVLWNRLIASVDEAAATLVRTAFSTVVRESNDFACQVLDAAGNNLAQNSVAAPSFVGTMPRTMRHFLERFPLETWREGDVVMTNDPWMGTGHLPDFSLAMPVFRKGKLAAFAANVAHMPDIGGTIWGADATQVFEEGLRILPTRMVREGQMNEHLVEMIAANVRVPDLTLGDLNAQIAACRMQVQRLERIMDDADLDDLNGLAEGIISRTEAAMTAALAGVPQGEYRYSLETDGFDWPLTIALRVVVKDGRILCDYTGTSSQVPRGLNSVYNYTYAYTAYPLKCALAPEVPNNEGICRRIDVTVPEGTLLNPRYPAPVGARNITGHFLSALVFGALFQAVPHLVMAEPAAPANRSVFTGFWDTGEPFSLLFFTSGGLGAQTHRDGLTCAAFPSNAGFASAEISENAAPVQVTQKSIRVNSAGAGRFRGGFGQDIGVRVLCKGPVTLSVLMDRVKHPPRGLAGGGPAAAAAIVRNGEPIPSKGRTVLQPGDTVLISCAGGGGLGDPVDRAPALIQQDLANGLITPGWGERQGHPQQGGRQPRVEDARRHRSP